MEKLNGEEIRILETDKVNNIVYVELKNGEKKWVNSSELETDTEVKPVKAKKKK